MARLRLFQRGDLRDAHPGVPQHAPAELCRDISQPIGNIHPAYRLFAVLAAVGVAAIVATSPLAFDAIRLGGAAYLVFLGCKSLRARPFEAGTQTTVRSPFENFRRGFLTNLLNPKAILFSGVFLPQFASPAFGPIFEQIVALGAVLALLGLLFQAAVSVASGSLGQWLLSSPRRQVMLERLMGVVFLGLAARLIVMERKG